MIGGHRFPNCVACSNAYANGRILVEGAYDVVRHGPQVSEAYRGQAQ